ncbi:small ribosomal subunit Rsm22 family protein [Streptomyces sp. DSM 44915]|uniref:Small ribosomal subunit Rsm22 family protein n=1 Tax=Streptomyces chisholmiae TaxID=3075540 RepID=A0ABU2JIF5_9ACTN|nr:small ribosomal subunit Rsm22 family protein [Streptomyces sp. DSM 44915]MDT0264764.1 small ribosomal subunit Rsm22 family protein [Streptomyces sp. DSM 44915]
MTSTSDQLRAALDRLLDGLPPRRAASAVERLMAGYRGQTPGPAPELRDRADAVAYAAYRMPATFEAVSAALAAFAARLPGWTPAGQLDLGGGTGAATWAAAGRWPGERPTLVLDRAGPALELGRELAGAAEAPAAVRGARWQRQLLGADLPPTELITVSYVLGELPAADLDPLVDAVAAAGRAVVLVEPGSPDGYLRIRAARDRLLAAGHTVLAPCPHGATCPLTVGDDWCHFAARVSRSALHRRVKGGELPYEDEKFAYVATFREPPVAEVADPPAPRVIRRPRQRKGQVLLDLCRPDGTTEARTVTKRHGTATYRQARDTGWGDTFPPAED